MIGGIETGGTKIICAVAEDENNIIERIKIDTQTPDVSIPKVVDFFKQYKIDAMGIGTFGPADINPESEKYGYITTTPKEGWRDYDLLGSVMKHFDIPSVIDTDVNGAALGEYNLGAGRGKESLVYMTVGTGVGAGAVLNGKTLHGISHPEMGHMILRRHPDDNYKGTCPYHLDCMEGLTAGPSILARTGKPGIELDDNHEVWNFLAYYIAQAVFNITLVLMPEVFILGGGVMQQKQLFAKIRSRFLEISNGYIQIDEIVNNVDSFIIAPQLGGDAGIKGALCLAKSLI